MNDITPQDSKVVDLDAKRSEQEKGKEDAKKRGPTNEHVWSNELRRKGDFAVERDESGAPILYRFDRAERYWKIVQNDTQLREQVIKFLNQGEHLGRFTKAAVDNLVSITTPYVASFMRKLQADQKKVLISTINHVLEVEKDIIRVHHKNDLPHGGKEYFCNTHVSVDLSKVIKSGETTYTQQSNIDIESKKTIWAGMVNSCFLDEDNRRVFQEFFGDLFNPQRRKAIPVLVGDPDCGKSQFILVGLKLHQRSTTFNISMEGFDMAPLLGKTVAFIDELPNRINETMLKRWIGGAIATISRKFKDDISITPQLKHLWCANKISNLYDKSGAMQSRFYPIQCDKFRGEKIQDIANFAIEENLVDIVDWCLNGCQAVMKRGRTLTQSELPKQSQAILENINKTANPAVEFIKELECTYSAYELTAKEEIYKSFVDYCNRHGHGNYAQINDATFFRDMFLPAIKMSCPEFDERLVRRATKTVTVGGRTLSQRVPCYPVVFKNNPFAKNIDKNEAERTYNDKTAYEDKDNTPDHIIEMILSEAEEQQDCLGLTDAQKKIYISRKLTKEGYTQDRKGSWYKDIIIGDKSISIDF